MGDAANRVILRLAMAGPTCARAILAECELAPPTVYRHIRRLMKDGLLVAERDAISKDGKRFTLYTTPLRSVSVKFDSMGPVVCAEWKSGPEPVDVWMAIRERKLTASS